MFKSKYVTSVAAGVVLASSIFMDSSALAAKNFTDLNADPSHAQSVKVLNSYDLFDYKAGNQLNGSAPVSRGEVSKILHNLFDGYIQPVRTYKNNFKDVKSSTNFQDSIIWAYEAGIFDGDSNGNFNPNQTLTRAQMAKVLVNAYELEPKGKATFKDVPASHWAYDYTNILGSGGYSVGSNGNFSPNNKVTLNQLSTFIYRIEGKPAMANTSQPVNNSTAQNVEFKTYEEVKKIAIDMYNNRGTEEQKVTVYTKEKVSTKFFEYMDIFNYDYTEDFKAHTKTYGFDIQMSSYEVPNKGYYETTIRLVYKANTAKDDYAKSLEKNKAAINYIKANYDISTNYKKVVAVADFLASQMTYNQPISKDNPYLYNHLNVMCEDYSDATTVLLDALGVKSRYVTGVTKKGPGHGWNAVKLDGQWYYVDVTYYDSDNGSNYDKYLVMTESELRTYIAKIDGNFKASDVPYNKQ